ncbi:MAG: hypothetical protein ACXW3F_07730 [Pyrinomonadaceae bacterium]
MKKLPIIFIPLVLIACAGNKLTLPIDTSLGKLVRIDQKQTVATDDRSIAAEDGKVFYVLSFEGKDQISYEGGEQDALQAFSLVDAKGTEFRTVFEGSPTDTGALSDKDWHYNGQLQGKNGKFVFVGTLTIPTSKITLVYSVPKGVSGLSLKDGERKHAIN